MPNSKNFYPKIGTSLLIIPALNSPIEISENCDFWLANPPLLTIPSYFRLQATLLEIGIKQISNIELIRYRIKFQYHGQEYIGWIHDYHTLICSE